MVDINTSDGAVLEALNNKVDTDLDNVARNIDYIIETGQSNDGLSWYRRYKSGWLEQGGCGYSSTTLAFPVTFANINYTFVATPIRMNPNVGSNDICYHNKTTLNIGVQLRFGGSAQSSDYEFMWLACGKGT